MAKKQGIIERVRTYFKEKIEQVRFSAARVMFPELYDQIIVSHHKEGIDQYEGDQQGDRAKTSGFQYRNSAYVQRAANVWRNTLTNFPIQVFEKRGKDRKEVEVREVQQLIDEPNPDYSFYELRRRTMLDLALDGECFWHVQLKRGLHIDRLYRVDAQDVAVQVNRREMIYGTPLRYQLSFLGEHVAFASRPEMIHFKFYNPLLPWRGIAPFAAIALRVQIEQLSLTWQHTFFKQGGRPDYAIVVPEGATQDEKEALQNALQMQHGWDRTAGRFNYFRPIVLEHDIMEIKPLNLKPVDIDLGGIGERQQEAVGLVYGVPREMMGALAAKYENLDQAERQFYTVTGVPLIGMFDDFMTQHLRRLGILSARQYVRTDITELWGMRRILNPVFDQARTLFFMGVPVKVISEYLRLQIPRYKGDETSNPLGTALAFDKEGKVIDETANKPRSQREEQIPTEAEEEVNESIGDD